MSQKIQLRRDTAANWTTTNPTLSAGEFGVETDTLKVKVGNGSTAWTALAYIAASGGGGAVGSVNAKTGTVVLSASDVGADAAGAAATAQATALSGAATDATSKANAAQAAAIQRANHTGTQAATTITGLATVATSGAYTDLSGKPTLGGAAALAVGTTTGTVAAGDDTRITSAVPATRTVNGKALTANISLTASDVGAQPTGNYATADEPIAAAETTRALAAELALAYPPNAIGCIPTNFKRYRRALSKVRTNTGPCKIACVGDSTTIGGGTGAVALSWPTYLAGILNSYHAPTQIGMVIPPSAVTDPRWALGSGWSLSNSNGWPASSGGYLAASGTSAALTFTPGFACDTFDIYYLKNTALGTFQASIDGGSATGQATAASAGCGKVTVSAGSVASNHVLSIANITVGPVFIVGVEAYTAATNTLRIANMGVSGTTTTPWATIASASAFTNYILTAYAPDLTIIMLGINDAGASTATATFQSQLTTIVNNARSNGGDALVMSCVPSNTGTNLTGEQAYYAANVWRTVAANIGVGYLDIYGRFESYAVGNPLGYYSDSLHPTQFGYADIAQAVFNTLKTI